MNSLFQRNNLEKVHGEELSVENFADLMLLSNKFLMSFDLITSLNYLRGKLKWLPNVIILACCSLLEQQSTRGDSC